MSVYDEIRAEREGHATRGYDRNHDSAHGVGHLVSWAFAYADGFRPGNNAPQPRTRADLIKGRVSARCGHRPNR